MVPWITSGPKGYHAVSSGRRRAQRPPPCEDPSARPDRTSRTPMQAKHLLLREIVARIASRTRHSSDAAALRSVRPKGNKSRISAWPRCAWAGCGLAGIFRNYDKLGLAHLWWFQYHISSRRGRGSAGRARPCQGRGRGFEPRRPLHRHHEAGHTPKFWPAFSMTVLPQHGDVAKW